MIDTTVAGAAVASDTNATPEAGASATKAVKTQRTASHRLFLDDVEYQSFVRRLDWSPDGNVLLTPSACFYNL